MLNSTYSSRFYQAAGKGILICFWWAGTCSWRLAAHLTSAQTCGVNPVSGRFAGLLPLRVHPNPLLLSSLFQHPNSKQEQQPQFESNNISSGIVAASNMGQLQTLQNQAFRTGTNHSSSNARVLAFATQPVPASSDVHLQAPATLRVVRWTKPRCCSPHRTS